MTFNSYNSKNNFMTIKYLDSTFRNFIWIPSSIKNYFTKTISKILSKNSFNYLSN